MQKESSIKRPILFGLFFLLAVYPLCLSFYGLDVTDFGFSLTSYYFVFDSPAPIQYLYANWGTNIIGGIIINLFDFAFSIKFAGVLVLWFTYWFCYLALKDYIHTYTIFISLLLITFLTFEINWLHYNHLTALFFTIAAYLLIRGLTKDQAWPLLLAGFFLSFNIYVRLPNLVGLGLAAIILLYYLKPFDWKRALKGLGLYFSGAVLGVIVPALIMKALNQWDSYYSSVLELLTLASGQGADSDYSGNSLLDLLINDHLLVLNSLIWAAGVWASFILVNFFGKHFRIAEKASSFAAILISLIVGGLIVAYYLERSFIIQFVGIFYLVLLASILKNRYINKELSLLSIIALYLLFATPLGSNNGIGNAPYGMYLALPIVLHSVIYLFPKEVEKRQLQALIIIPFLFFSITLPFQNIYRDSSNFFLLNHFVSEGKLKGNITTEYRAEALMELNTALEEFVSNEDSYFVYEEIPIVPYLVEEPPAIPNPWPMLYRPDIFSEKLDALKQTGTLP